ncbi:hypothetical protein GobsT_44930 [Gemmata obscuriglobus]|nr:hypothetical protein GobsT_44930 [Gemmata obscuriglobus]VTS09012.1 unnamed protein product [Gemmata obscuriglobus UQM 2246]
MEAAVVRELAPSYHTAGVMWGFRFRSLPSNTSAATPTAADRSGPGGTRLREV